MDTAMLKSHNSSDASDLPFGLVPAEDTKPVKRHRFAHNPAGTNFLTRLSARIYSYILEWVLFLLVIIIPLACIVVFIPFRDKAISLLDHTIQQPYIVHDTLPILSVFLPSLTVSLTFFAIYPVLLGRYARSQGLPAHTHAGRYFYWWTTCLIQTIGVTVLLSELSKRLVQAPRPDFLHRCFPGGVPEHIRLAAVNNNYIVDTALCTPESRAIFEDGLQSVPSEHTSLTWCIMVNLVMFFMSMRKELLQVALINRTKIAAAHQERRARRLAHYASSTSLNSSTLRRRGSRSTVTSESVPSYSPEPSTGGTATAPAAAPAIVAPPPPMAAAQAPRSLPNPIDTQDATFHAPTLIEYGASPPASPGSDPNTEPEHIARVAFWPVSDVVAIAHVVFPFGWAILVSFSRTFDHRHAFPDVMCGFVLGVTIAFAVCWMHRSHFESYHASWYEKQEEKRTSAGALPLQPIGGVDAKEYQPLAADEPQSTTTTKTLEYPSIPPSTTTTSSA